MVGTPVAVKPGGLFEHMSRTYYLKVTFEPSNSERICMGASALEPPLAWHRREHGFIMVAVNTVIARGRGGGGGGEGRLAHYTSNENTADAP